MPSETRIVDPSRTDAAPRRRRRWWRRLPLIVGLLSLTVWMLPTLIAVTPLRNVVLNMAQSQLPDGMTVGSARLSWTEPVQLNDVRVEDQAGREVLHVERIESEETLWELARERLNKGLFHLFKPRLTLVVREKSTVLDPAVLRTIRSQQESLMSKSGRRGISFDLANGELALVDKDGNLLTELTDIEVNFHNPADADQPGRLHVIGRVSQPETGGSLSLSADWSGRTPLTSSGQIEAQLLKVPVDAINPRIRARMDGRRLSGSVSSTLSGTWQPAEDGRLDASAQLNAAEILLSIISPEPETAPIEWNLADSVVECEALYDGRSAFEFERLVVQSQPLTADVSGTIAREADDLVVDLEGELTSDPDLFVDFLGEWAQRYVAVDGLTARRIALNGPVPLTRRVGEGTPHDETSAAPMTVGQAEVAWSSMSIAGLRSDNGVVDVLWQGDRIQLAPRSVTFGGGRVLASPWVDLSGSPRVLVIDPGPVADHVQFTPDMTRTWLRYVSPLMADATSIDGRFSLASNGARVPLSPGASEPVQGTLQIHTAQVGPGPAAQKILPVVEQVRALLKGTLPNPFGGGGRRDEAWLMLGEQAVQVWVENRRVYHDRIAYSVGDAVLTSSGSVGFDDSLDLTVEIPLQEKWLGSQLMSLKGESLKIPVTGTLDAPVVDPRPLTEFNKQLAGRAAEGLLQRLLGD
jgi:hypothetical protein